MADGQIVIEVLTDLTKGVQNAAKGATKIGADMSKRIAGPLNAAVNTAAVGIIAGVAVAATAGAKAAVEFEDAFALVKKTMADVDDPQVFKELAQDLQSLATQIPVRASELAQLASVAGQLGVASDDVAQFVEVTGKLSVATNLTGTQAATSLARFLNVTNQTTDTVGKFGSVLVELGNNVAATESEIILLAQNFGATGTIAGLSAEDILAFSAATRETGVQAAAGATALGKFFMNLSDATKLGGDRLAKFAETAGMSISEFKNLAETDVASAAQAFLEGLNAISASGESVTPVLQELGLNNVRTARSILSLANNSEGLAEALSLARQEAVEQNALNKEAETRFETVSQKVAQLRSIMNVFLQQLGESFLPLISKVLDGLITFAKGLVGLVRGFRELSDTVKGFFKGIGLFTLITAFKNLVKVSGSLNGPMQKIIGAMKGLGKFVKAALGPLLALVTVVIPGIMKIGKAQDRFDDFNTVVNNTTNSVKELAASGEEFADAFNEETLRGIAEGLPKGLREGVQEAIDSGQLTESGIEASQQFASQFTGGLTNLLRNAIDAGDLVKGVDNIKEIDKVIQEIRSRGLDDEFTELVSLTEKLKSELENNDGVHNDITRSLQNQLALHLAIIEATNNQLSLEEQLRNELIEYFTTQGDIEKLKEAERRGDEFILRNAMLLKETNMDIRNILIEMNKIPGPTNFTEAFETLEEKANSLKDAVDAIFLPGQLDFERRFADLDLREARQEQVDLEQELIDLKAEEIETAEELKELTESQVMTAEEVVEQQELINEALEIEDRLRKGLALSANDQLRREKLRKDRRRVELAAAQGSLEFADLELKAIDENISAIEDRAVTQADADEKRADALEISEKAQERRQQNIEDIEKRRLEINERLAEMPRAQLEAASEVFDAQKAILDINLKIVNSVQTLSSVTVLEAQRMAEALKLPVEALSALNAGANVSAPMAASLSSKYNMPTGNFTTKTQVGSNVLAAKRALNSTSMGSSSVANNNSSGSSIVHNNTFNNNFSSMPVDPMLAKKAAENIRRELNKLEKDVRSGVVR